MGPHINAPGKQARVGGAGRQVIAPAQPSVGKRFGSLGQTSNTRRLGSIPFTPAGRKQIAAPRKQAAPATSNKRKAESDTQNCTVRVWGYDMGTDKELIEQHCSKCGLVLNCEVSKKHAIVTFSSPEEAQEAVQTLDKTTIEGNTRYVDVKLWEIRGGRDGNAGEGEPNAKRAKVTNDRNRNRGGQKANDKKDKGPSVQIWHANASLRSFIVVRWSCSGAAWVSLSRTRRSTTQTPANTKA